MLEFLFLVLGIAVGYNIRHERQVRQENLVLSQVDAKLRHELAVAVNLNQSLLADLAALKKTQSQVRTGVRHTPQHIRAQDGTMPRPALGVGESPRMS